jgi:hypothetical protein
MGGGQLQKTSQYPAVVFKQRRSIPKLQNENATFEIFLFAAVVHRCGGGAAVCGNVIRFCGSACGAVVPFGAVGCEACGHTQH